MSDSDDHPDSLSARLHRAERELSLLRALLDLLPDFFYVHDADIRYAYANRAAANYFGVPKDRLVGRLLSEVEKDPAQAKFFTDLCKRILADGTPRLTDELPLRMPDGSTRYLRQHDIPFTDPSTGAPMLAGISRDVTADRAALDERLRRERAERELEVAREVQRSLLPKQTLTVGGFEVAGACVPSFFAAGDFYDWFACPPTNPDADRTDAPRRGRVRGEVGGGAIVLGDATGHGIGPALLATACKAYVRAAFPDATDLSAAVARVNTLLSADLADGTFVTLAAVTLEPDGTARFHSAGHGPVLLLRPGRFPKLLDSHGPPLGIAPDLPFDPATELRLHPRDTLLILSDGLHESFSPEGTQLGLEQLTSLAHTHRHLPPTDLARTLIDHALAHTARPTPADDMTVVVVRRQ